MKARQFWYPLPERLIAQHPAERRGTERMMVLHRDTGVIEHRHIADIVEFLTPNDLLVVNDTKVFPARLIGTWADTPGEVEVLMVAAAPEAETVKELVWNVIIGSGRKCREGQTAVFGPNGELKAHLLAKLEGIGMWKVAFECERPLMDLLEEFGHTPVPPYVHREGTREEEMEDRERYQTIYAKHVGSVAAPTAGLHFTEEIFAALERKGVKRCAVTLHVGPGTFRPVKTEEIEDHHMDFEAFTVPPETAEAINAFYQYRVDDTLNFEVPMNADYYRGQDPEKDVTVDVSYRVTCNSDAFFSILITTRQDGLTTCAGHTFSRTDVRAGSTVALRYLLGLLETGEKDTWLQDRQTARADALVREMVWERLQETDGAELYDGLDRESLEYGFFPEEDFYLDETGNPVFYLEPGFAKDGGEPLLFPISIAEILDEM